MPATSTNRSNVFRPDPNGFVHSQNRALQPIKCTPSPRLPMSPLCLNSPLHIPSRPMSCSSSVSSVNSNWRTSFSASHFNQNTVHWTPLADTNGRSRQVTLRDIQLATPRLVACPSPDTSELNLLCYEQLVFDSDTENNDPQHGIHSLTSYQRAFSMTSDSNSTISLGGGGGGLRLSTRFD